MRGPVPDGPGDDHDGRLGAPVRDAAQGVTDAAEGVTDAARGVTDAAQGVTDAAQGVTDAARAPTAAATMEVPARVLDVLAARYGTSAAQLRRLGGGKPSSDGVRYAMPGDPPHILKVQSSPTVDAVGRIALTERVEVGASMATNGAPLPRIRRSEQGQLVEITDEAGSSYTAYAMEHLRGRTLGSLSREERTPHLRRLGAELALLHRLSERRSPWRASRTRIDGEPVLSWEAEWAHVARVCTEPAIREVWGEIRQTVAALPVERQTFGFVHNDPHLHNVLVDADRLAFIDLDVATYHWFMADLATTLLAITGEGSHDDTLAHEQVRRVLDGYLMVRPAAAGSLATLPVHLDYRRALLYIVLRDELTGQTRETWRRTIESGGSAIDPAWLLARPQRQRQRAG